MPSEHLLTNLVIGPATKVPGLVFCAGQTATGEIKQATVSLVTQLAVQPVALIDD
jgi:hypothetical protein